MSNKNGKGNTAKIEELKVLFGYTKTAKAPVILDLSNQEAEAIFQNSPSTAEKLIHSNKIVQKEDGTWGIKIKVLGSLSVGETVEQQNTASTEMIVSYQELAAELLELGFKDEELTELIFLPTNHHKLAPEQRDKAIELCKKAQVSQNKELSDVTGFISSRVVGSWQFSDTLALPDTLFYAIQGVIKKEREGWDSEVDASPKSEEPLTITAEKA